MVGVFLEKFLPRVSLSELMIVICIIINHISFASVRVVSLQQRRWR